MAYFLFIKNLTFNSFKSHLFFSDNFLDQKNFQQPITLIKLQYHLLILANRRPTRQTRPFQNGYKQAKCRLRNRNVLVTNFIFGDSLSVCLVTYILNLIKRYHQHPNDLRWKLGRGDNDDYGSLDWGVSIEYSALTCLHFFTDLYLFK